MKKQVRIWSLFFIITVILFVLMMKTGKIQYGERVSVSNCNDYYMNVETWEISSDNIYSQTFQYQGNKLYSFSLRYAAVEEISGVVWTVQLYDDKGEVIGSWIDNGENIKNNVLREYVINDDGQEYGPGDYEIRISGGSSGKTGIVLCGSEKDTLAVGTLRINGEDQDGDLSLEYSEIVNVKITVLYGILFAAVCAIILLWFFSDGWRKIVAGGNLFIKWLYKNKTKIVIYLALMFGISIAAFLFLRFTGHFWMQGEASVEFNYYRWIYFTVAGWIMLVFFGQKNFLMRKPEILICTVLSLTGLLYIIEIPALAEVSWDESIHFWRTVGVSHATTGMANQAECYIYWRAGIPLGLPGSIQYMHGLYDNVQTMYNAGIRIAANTDILSSCSVIAYLPAAIMLKIGRMFSLPFWIVYKMGLTANLVLYISCIYFAIKKLISGKMIAAVVASMGTVFFLMTVYSTDGWIIALSILGFSWFIGCMQKKETISGKEQIIMIASLTLAFFPKAVYFPMLLLLVLIPKKKFSDKGQYLRFISGVFASIFLLMALIAYDSLLVIAAWPVFYSLSIVFFRHFLKLKFKVRCFLLLLALMIGIGLGYVCLPMIVGSGDVRGGAAVDAQAQVMGILRDPWEYFSLLMKFIFKNYIFMEQSWRNLFVNLGYIGTTNYHIWGLLLLVLTGITDKTENDRWKGYGLTRVAAVILSLLCVMMFASAMYISFTPVGENTIFGCQQRYMLPLVFPVFVCIGSSKLVNPIRKSGYRLLIMLCSICLLMINIWEVAAGLYW